jgi:hypothetical protein
MLVADVSLVPKDPQSLFNLYLESVGRNPCISCGGEGTRADVFYPESWDTKFAGFCAVILPLCDRCLSHPPSSDEIADTIRGAADHIRKSLSSGNN